MDGKQDLAAQQNKTGDQNRTVEQWVNEARAGQVALADFQRSFVWQRKRASRYINAILRGRPVGFFLILKAAPSPQFSARQFSAMKTPVGKAQELVLDGQQRLTSLLQAIYGHPDWRFFIEVEDLGAETLELKEVVAYGHSSLDAKRLNEPTEAYRSNHIPIDVLKRPEGNGGTANPLAKWCNDAGSEIAGSEIAGSENYYNDVYEFQTKIEKFANARFFQRKLFAWQLPAETTRAEATEIFIETNTSSVRIKKFDEHVAKVRGSENHDFRKLIGKARQESEVLRHFFPGNDEKTIPAIGTWLLKLGCLHAGVPPKEGNYEDGTQYLFGNGGKKANGTPTNLQGVLEDVEWVLKRVADRGSPSEATLPSWPPVHVLAAIRSRYQQIKDSEELNAARLLIDAYYWRSLFTNRYERQANDNLYKDLGELVDIFDGERPNASSMRIFCDQHHPLLSASKLEHEAGWISRSRVGKALMAVILASDQNPVDWITGEPLGVTHVRELERIGKLDRHHVFPKDVLVRAGVPEGEINNGLNGVLLDKRTNRRFWKYPPVEYVENVTKRQQIEKAELRRRIVGHFVPFEEMVDTKGTMKDSYERFRTRRATLLAERIKKLATAPKQRS